MAITTAPLPNGLLVHTPDGTYQVSNGDGWWSALPPLRGSGYRFDLVDAMTTAGFPANIQRTVRAALGR